MRPRCAVLLTPLSPTPAFLQNVAKSCICHTSEKSPVTPIIATDPKMRSCKSCVCHTCDPLPSPPFHLLLPFFLPPPVTDHESRRYFFGAAAVFAPATSSTPKSQTKRFMPSGRISARAYSPGGSGSPSVKRNTVGAISQRCNDMVLRVSSTCSPKYVLMDSNFRLLPLTVARTSSTSGPDSPGRLLFTMGLSRSGSDRKSTRLNSSHR